MEPFTRYSGRALVAGWAFLGLACASTGPATRPGHSRPPVPAPAAIAPEAALEPAPSAPFEGKPASGPVDPGAGPLPDPAPDPAPDPSPDTRVDTPVDASPLWLVPLTEMHVDHIISGFGDARGGGKRRHGGIDIRADRGTPVHAPVAGRVLVSGPRARAGELVILEVCDDGLELHFAHLASRSVRRGDQVKAGQQIGTVGSSGNASTPHLHYEIRGAKGPIDPYPLLLQGSRCSARVLQEARWLPR